jgi:hypothetical protein
MTDMDAIKRASKMQESVNLLGAGPTHVAGPVCDRYEYHVHLIDGGIRTGGNPRNVTGRTDLCPDCGHHLHRPNPGKCGWHDCPCASQPPSADAPDLRAVLTDEAMRDILVVLPPPDGFADYADAVRERLIAALERSADQ